MIHGVKRSTSHDFPWIFGTETLEDYLGQRLYGSGASAGIPVERSYLFSSTLFCGGVIFGQLQCIVWH